MLATLSSYYVEADSSNVKVDLVVKSYGKVAGSCPRMCCYIVVDMEWYYVVVAGTDAHCSAESLWMACWTASDFDPVVVVGKDWCS